MPLSPFPVGRTLQVAKDRNGVTVMIEFWLMCGIAMEELNSGAIVFVNCSQYSFSLKMD